MGLTSIVMVLLLVMVHWVGLPWCSLQNNKSVHFYSVLHSSGMHYPSVYVEFSQWKDVYISDLDLMDSLPHGIFLCGLIFKKSPNTMASSESSCDSHIVILLWYDVSKWFKFECKDLDFSSMATSFFFKFSTVVVMWSECSILIG